MSSPILGQQTLRYPKVLFLDLFFFYYASMILLTIQQARHVYFLMASNTIQFSSPNVLELEVIMTHDMATNLNWSRQWRMQFNALKSVFVPFTNKLLRTPVEILLINIAIKKSTAHKHLGVLLQSNCNWDSQINFIIKTASKRMCILQKIKLQISRGALSRLYLTNLGPMLEYGMIVLRN